MLRQVCKRSLQLAAGDVEGGGKPAEERQGEVVKRRRKKRAQDVCPKSKQTLEQLVFGGEEEILDKLSSRDKNIIDSKKKKSVHVLVGEQRKPVWEDDEEEVDIPSTRYCKEIPEWAKLDKEEQDSEGDSDVDELLRTTGNYLTSSSSLPPSKIQVRRCTDVNRDAPSGRLRALEFHPNARVALTAGINCNIQLFQVDGENNPKIQSLVIKNYPIFSAHFSSDGEQVIIGTSRKNFCYYDMIAGSLVKMPQIKGLEENNMKRLAVSPDGKFLVFLGSYGFMHLLSATTKEWIRSLKMNGSVESVSFSADGSRMFSHGDEGQVYIWDMNARDCIHTFYDEGCVKGTKIAASCNGKYLACGSYSGVVNVYNTESCLASRSPKPLRAVMNLLTPCTSMHFNSSSEILAIASDHAEKSVKLLHLPSLTVFENFPDRLDNKLRIPVHLDFSPHSGYLTVGNHKGNALLYRIKHYGKY